MKKKKECKRVLHKNLRRVGEYLDVTDKDTKCKIYKLCNSMYYRCLQIYPCRFEV